MKLSKLYTNFPTVFEPIDFNSDLNVVLGEVRLPENKDKDTHNLGKSTIGRLIDFTLLSKRNPDFFLFKHEKQFSNFEFYLEIELTENSYITIFRAVESSTKISFKRHNKRHQDFSVSNKSEWDHSDLAFERAKSLLDGILNLNDLKPWDYRKGLGYLVRTQDDYLDVFKLKRFAGAEVYMKPYLAQLIGFNAQNIQSHYEKEADIEYKEKSVSSVSKELSGFEMDLGKVEGVLPIKKREASERQNVLDSFDFENQDKQKTAVLVDEIDEEIAGLNSRRYSLYQNRKKIIKSLEKDSIIFNPEQAQKIYAEAGILFEGQIKKDFEELIGFNKAITEERLRYLKAEKLELDQEIVELDSRLSKINGNRAETLEYLSDTDIFSRYKLLSNEMVSLKSDIETLSRQRSHLQRLQELRNEVKKLIGEKDLLQVDIESDVADKNANDESLFSKIRIYFAEIVSEVINRNALLSVTVNTYGHLQFKAEILNESGQSTSADAGHTYKKLLCIAFDLAVLRAYSNKDFPHFVFHDGVFESLDNRKKENLLRVIRRYTEYGLQSIITLIDSDLPDLDNVSQPIFTETEYILKLHDEGEQGRLFKMPSW